MKAREPMPAAAPPPLAPRDATDPLGALTRALTRVVSAAHSGDEGVVIAAAGAALVEWIGGRSSCVVVEPGLVGGASSASVVWSSHRDLDRLPISLARYPEMQLALAHGEVIHAADVHVDPRLASVRELLPPALRSTCVVPMALGGARRGLLVVQSTEAQTLAPEVVRALAALGEVTGGLLDGACGRTSTARAPAVTSATGVVRVPPAGSDVATDRRRVLVVEDDPALRETLADLLERHGYAVDVAVDGEHALEVASAQPPELVLLDVHMPGLDGFGVSARLADDPRTRRVPIVFLSGADDLMTRVRTVRLAEVDFMTKPVKPSELLSRIERVLSRGAEHARLRAAAHLDELTGLGNLRALQERVGFETLRRRRYGTPLAVVVLDVDRLKQLNDTHGHLEGSRALAGIGAVLRELVRDTDLAVRYGGDEFVVLLAHADVDDALRLAERVLAGIAELRICGEPVHVSVGVAALTDGDPRSFEEVMRAADEAAYRAKRDGGGRLCVAPAVADAG
ncbi:MAG: diguanylate cyclase [Kofleriaceae bacterium]